MTKKIVFAIALLAGLAIGVVADPPPRSLPEFKLTAVTISSSKTVHKKDLSGKVWIANFIFTRCTGVCPMSSGKMQTLQRKLPSKILLVSFTVDPKHDQAQALRRYAKRFHAQDGRWWFMTAPNEEILLPLYKDGFNTAYRPNTASACGYETYHSSKFFLIDRQGAIHGEYVSEEPAQMRKLEADALRLANEDSQASARRSQRL